MASDFHKLLEGIFMCGEQAVQAVTETETIRYVVDLRAEASEGMVKDDSMKWIHIPLEDGVPNQTENLQKAISFVSTAYKEGKHTVLH